MCLIEKKPQKTKKQVIKRQIFRVSGKLFSFQVMIYILYMLYIIEICQSHTYLYISDKQSELL